MLPPPLPVHFLRSAAPAVSSPLLADRVALYASNYFAVFLPVKDNDSHPLLPPVSVTIRLTLFHVVCCHTCVMGFPAAGRRLRLSIFLPWCLPIPQAFFLGTSFGVLSERFLHPFLSFRRGVGGSIGGVCLARRGKPKR